MRINEEYLGFIEMSKELQEIILQLEENGGELTPELQEDYELLIADRDDRIFRAWNIIAETEGIINNRKARIKALEDKNTVSANSIKQWKLLIIAMLKEANNTNSNGSYVARVGDLNISVSKSESVEVGEEFNDPSFISFELKKRISSTHMERIKNFLSQQTGEDEIPFTKVVDKNALKKAINEGAVFNDVEIKTNDKLTIR